MSRSILYLDQLLVWVNPVKNKDVFKVILVLSTMNSYFSIYYAAPFFKKSKFHVLCLINFTLCFIALSFSVQFTVIVENCLVILSALCLFNFSDE